MEAKAKLMYLRISPRKVKIVLDLIRGKDVGVAAAILMQTPKAASEPVLKLLKSAAANAENNHQMDPEKLYVSACCANPGPIIKRIMPRAQGRAYRINKRAVEDEKLGVRSDLSVNLIHVLLNNLGKSLIVCVACLSCLEEDVGILCRTSLAGMLGIKRMAAESVDCVLIHHILKVLIIPHLNAVHGADSQRRCNKNLLERLMYI